VLKDEPVRVAVIGVGNIGFHHARIYSEMKQVNLVGVCDTHETKCKLISQQYNIPYFTDYRALFGKVDAVNIAVPTSLHYSMANEFLEHDIHVLVEKPLTVDTGEAKLLVEMAKRNNLVLQVGHLERFNPTMSQLRKMLKKPLYIEAHRLSYPTDRNLDVGIVWDLMIHDLDIIISIINSPAVEINGFGLSVYSEHEDLAIVQIHFQSGCIANLVASRMSGEKLRNLRIMEKDKTFNLDFMNQTLAVLRPPKANQTNPPEFIPIKREEPLRLELENFAECVRTRKTPVVTGEDGKKALELAMNVMKHIKTIKGKASLARELLSIAK